MVWPAVTASGRSLLVFLPNYIVKCSIISWNCLGTSVEPLGTQIQDSAPYHKARDTEEWLENNVPSCISSDQWPPYSTDANPLDYLIWEHYISRDTLHILITLRVRNPVLYIQKLAFFEHLVNFNIPERI